MLAFPFVMLTGGYGPKLLYHLFPYWGYRGSWEFGLDSTHPGQFVRSFPSQAIGKTTIHTNAQTPHRQAPDPSYCEVIVLKQPLNHLKM